MKNDIQHYPDLFNTIKARIRQAQIKASLSANAEMILMYWDIGRMIHERQQEKGWGSGVIPRLAKDIRNDMPEVKGFSGRNIGYMIRFAREYGSLSILQQPVAKLESSPEEGKPDALTTEKGKVPQPVAKIRCQEMHIPKGVAEGLRRRGIDVLTIQGAGRVGDPDRKQLAFAALKRRGRIK